MAEEDRQTGTPSRAQVAEYLLIVALIVVVAIAVLALFGTQIGDLLAWIAQEIHTQ